MSLFDIKPRTVTPLIDLKPGYFAKVDQYYLLPVVELSSSDCITLSALPGTCMFQMYQGLLGDTLAAYAFSSAFQVVNGGGYLLTRLGNDRPTEHTVLLRTPNIVIYSFGSSGALAVSLKVNESVSRILESQ